MLYLAKILNPPPLFGRDTHVPFDQRVTLIWWARSPELGVFNKYNIDDPDGTLFGYAE